MAARTTTRNQARQQRTRERLLRAAYALMSQTGVDDTSINAITDSADVGFGTFYNYFGSKDDIAANVLDCVIDNLGRRNDLVTRTLGEQDPVRIVANSVRLVAREMLVNPIWTSWVTHPELVTDRMRDGFRPFGRRDFDRAVLAGAFDLIDDDFELAWGRLIWTLVGGVKDILDGRHPLGSEDKIVEGLLRMLGVTSKAAAAATTSELPSHPDLEIDFSFNSRRGD